MEHRNGGRGYRGVHQHQRLPGAAHTRPCLVSANHSLHPYIDAVEEGLVVATEGERGVMAADEIGTARLAATGEWRDGLPQELFTARWLDDEQ
ncbi:hypothetical protein ACFZBU_45205 [Embleya sp. NPDC008237]|uniref:hypothetical protein n=1 Tax=Embleya sp. NPDC008237 TaxID=3363978 RepID=UPI0036E74F46